MESVKSTTKKYNKLIEDVKTKEFYKTDSFKDKVNCYTCEKCNYITKTKYIDIGTIPFMINCVSCKGDAQSSFYNDILPDKSPTHEWYRPDLKTTLKLRSKHSGTLEHVLLGGLLIRKIK